MGDGPRGVTAASYGGSVFNFLRHPCTVVHSSRPLCQRHGVPGSALPCPCLSHSDSCQPSDGHDPGEPGACFGASVIRGDKSCGSGVRGTQGGGTAAGGWPACPIQGRRRSVLGRANTLPSRQFSGAGGVVRICALKTETRQTQTHSGFTVVLCLLLRPFPGRPWGLLCGAAEGPTSAPGPAGAALVLCIGQP